MGVTHHSVPGGPVNHKTQPVKNVLLLDLIKTRCGTIGIAIPQTDLFVIVSSFLLPTDYFYHTEMVLNCSHNGKNK